ncbi:MAG: YkgJ family cysteine cluster protein [Nevskiales bacterium]|nr:YkgJ family cysteine cluster protein [Nevskiales bacterium]
MTAPFYAQGLRFECTGCGKCCRSRNDKSSWVYVTLEERRRLARHFKLSTSAFTRRYCEKAHGFFHLRDPSSDCLFLEGARCTVYAARPGQCRTFPFWRENMSKRVWEGSVARECEGVGRGRLWTREDIELRLEDERKRDSQC